MGLKNLYDLRQGNKMMNKRKKILDATVGLFVRNGIKKITVDEIAAYAKVSKVTLYKYFTDKDTLFYEVGAYLYTLYKNRLVNVVSSKDVLIGKLRAYLSILSDFADSGHYALCNDLAAYNIRLEEVAALYQQTYHSTMYQLIDQGIESGLMRPECGRELIFYYINMGVGYFQNDEEYRKKIKNDICFQNDFMRFYLGNIFMDKDVMLPQERSE